jgi:membrane protein implicated in regulation of membrane protease activity
VFATIVAFLHLGALLAALAYAIALLVRGNTARAGLILILLAIYYAFLLHPAVMKEIRRKRALKRGRS